MKQYIVWSNTLFIKRAKEIYILLCLVNDAITSLFNKTFCWHLYMGYTICCRCLLVMFHWNVFHNKKDFNRLTFIVLCSISIHFPYLWLISEDLKCNLDYTTKFWIEILKIYLYINKNLCIYFSEKYCEKLIYRYNLANYLSCMRNGETTFLLQIRLVIFHM